jgi:mycothiol synthase
MNIRKATGNDFEAIANVINSVWPDNRTTAEALEEDYQKTPERITHGDFVAELNGKIVAYADYSQFIGMYHPQKFGAWIDVMPEHRNKGIGTALYNTILEELRPYNPISLRTDTREDQAAGLHLIKKWGFVESKKYWESRLNVKAFDLTPHARAEEKASAHAIKITDLAELSKRDADSLQKYYDLWCEARQDVPRPEPATEVPFEEWRSFAIDTPYLIPEGSIIAVDKTTGTYVGLSQLYKAEDGEYLETGLTGVRRDYRRKGIALAMKIKGIAYAKSINAPEIRTGNESNNQAILSINERLGYVKEPIWIDFVKTSGFSPLLEENP